MTDTKIGVLTGSVGVGKTTIAGRVAGLAQRQGLTCGGLLAPAMVDGCGEKVGIWGHDLATGERRVLARTSRDLGGPVVGPYSFSDSALPWSVSLVEHAVGHCDLLIVDEIGKLELERGIGLAPVLPRLASGDAGRSLVLVRDYLLASLIRQLGLVQAVVFRADEENRGELAPQIMTGLMPDGT